MNGITLMIIGIIVLGAGYLFYGRWLAKTWGIDPHAPTPAYTHEDGVDYVPADANVVFGHQFASIAGAGPINGPIQAAIFGWVPVLLWILIGGVFFGAMQDFASMYASVKNDGRGIGTIIERYIGRLGKQLFLVFCWFFCILMIAAFADIVAGTFNGYVLQENGQTAAVAANGSVASTSLCFIAEAVLLGFLLRHGHLKKWQNTLIAIAMLVFAVWFGLQVPVMAGRTLWQVIIFVYIFIACVVPVWALLQPRDYLNSYLLIFMIAAALIGIVVSNPPVHLTAFAGFTVDGQMLFPILFVTIACGAVSGFHSLVSSGTASKQIRNEKDMLPVAYGAMIMESMLALIALICVASFQKGEAAAAGLVTQPQIFAGAIANFLQAVRLPWNLTYTLINLAVSAFALTSLDSVARIGRLAFQEFFSDSQDHPRAEDTRSARIRRLLQNKYAATALTLLLALALAQVGYAEIWALFGSANQLLSVLALVACAAFFSRTHRNARMMYIPMGFMMAVTFTALAMTIFSLGGQFLAGTLSAGRILQLAIAILLLVLGVIVAVQGIRTLRQSRAAQ